MSAKDNDSNANLEELFEVLKGQTTLDSVRTLLKGKRLPYSAQSWETMIGKRLTPYLNDGRLLTSEVMELIRESEEHGNKHVFLYHFDKSKTAELQALLSEEPVAQWLAENSYPALGSYVLLSYPGVPTVSEVRIDAASGTFVFKLVRTLKRKLSPEIRVIDGEEVAVSKFENFRAVDVLKVHTNGLIEVRVHPRRGAISYSGAAAAMIGLVESLLGAGMISDFSLAPVKGYFTDVSKKGEMAGTFEVYDADFKTAKGERISSSALADEGGIQNADFFEELIPQVFSHGDDPYCESVRVGYQFGNLKKINIVFTDEPNEMFFTQNISSDQYSGALKEVLQICGHS